VRIPKQRLTSNEAGPRSGSGVGSYSARKAEVSNENYQEIARERAAKKRQEDDIKYKQFLEKEERGKQLLKEEMQRKVAAAKSHIPSLSYAFNIIVSLGGRVKGQD